MEPTVLLAVAAAFAAGLAVGLVLLRVARAHAALEAGRAAAQELAALRQVALDRERRAAELSAVVARHEQRAERDAARLVTLSADLARAAAELDAERRAAAERAAEAERSREQVRAEVEVLAGRLLDDRGQALLDRSREGLAALLGPVAEKLRAFEAKVERTYDQESRDRASLLASLRHLQEAQARLHADAERLARALTGDSKAQGDWGELVLERVLETAGLAEGREYDLQVSHVDEDGGRRRPDALVYLPGDRVVVVDAKCSLTAFVEAMGAASPEAREAALDAHVASVRAHVRGLAARRYPELVKERTVDLVLLFVPSEAAFHAALTRAAGLYEEAFRERVVICSPTTLLAALQLVGHVWRSERQNLNAQRIAEEAGRLLDKLQAFVGDLDEVGARLDQAQASFQAARSKLASGRGNVLRKAADVVRLGARVKPDTAERLVLEAAAADDDEGERLLPEPAVAIPAAPGSRTPPS